MFSLLKSLDGRLRKLSCTITMSVSHTFPVTAQSFYPQFFNTLFPTQHTHTLEGAHTHKPWDKPLAGTQIRNRTTPQSQGRHLSVRNAKVRPGLSQDPLSGRTRPPQAGGPAPPAPAASGSEGRTRAGAEAAGQAGAGLTVQAARCSSAMCLSAAVNSRLAACLGSPSGVPHMPGAEPPQAPSEAERSVRQSCCRKPSALGGGLPSTTLASVQISWAAMAPAQWEAGSGGGAWPEEAWPGMGAGRRGEAEQCSMKTRLPLGLQLSPPGREKHAREDWKKVPSLFLKSLLFFSQIKGECFNFLSS